MYVDPLGLSGVGLWESCENNFGNFDSRYYSGIIPGIIKIIWA